MTSCNLTEERVVEIEKSLADNDGSFRDINFQLPKDDLVRLLEFFLSHIKIRNANLKMHDASVDVKADLEKGNYDSIFNGVLIISSIPDETDLLIPDLDCLISQIEDSLLYDVEFFFRPAHYKLNDFLRFLIPLVKASGVTEYYVKYENVSWRYGDCESHGVIFSHHDLPLQ